MYISIYIVPQNIAAFFRTLQQSENVDFHRFDGLTASRFDGLTASRFDGLTASRASRVLNHRSRSPLRGPPGLSASFDSVVVLEPPAETAGRGASFAHRLDIAQRPAD